MKFSDILVFVQRHDMTNDVIKTYFFIETATILQISERKRRQQVA